MEQYTTDKPRVCCGVTVYRAGRACTPFDAEDEKLAAAHPDLYVVGSREPEAPPAVVELLATPDHELDRFKVGELRTLAEQLEVDHTGLRKGDLIAEIIEARRE